VILNIFPGALVVFEGPDGTGKTSLAAWTKSHLETLNTHCDLHSFPGRNEGTLGKHIYDLHHNSSSYGVRSIHPASLQLMHVASHIDILRSTIQPAIDSGRTVVLDRFWWSTRVYGHTAGVSNAILDAILNVEQLYLQNLKPSVLFLVGRREPLRSEQLDTWEILSATYRQLAIRERGKYPIVHLNNDKSFDDTTKLICSALAKYLPGKIRLATTTSKKKTNSSVQGNQRASRVMSLSPAQPTVVYDTYWRFACERQSIFFKKFRGGEHSWTSDSILRTYKFTNAYRASDRTSQYMIRHVAYAGETTVEEVVFRILLFKIFNKIETWQLLSSKLGGSISSKDFSYNRYDAILSSAMDRGQRIYSAAYIMPTGTKTVRESKKHRMHLKLLESMLKGDLPRRLQDSPSMGKAFELLRSFPSIGDFLAYQYITDINYSNVTNFSESEFVVAGPGARDGIRKCFSNLGGLTENEIIKVVAERQNQEFERLGLDFQTLWGRPLQLIDCQNLFCEVDKYARVKHPEVKGISGRARIKQMYHQNVEPIMLWYPPKWGLNAQIEKEGGND
jgi:thymidylate kinase